MRISNNTEWLFFHLWKKDPTTHLSCPNIYIPETILYRWGQPQFWYSTARDGTIIRRLKEKITLPNIETIFGYNLSRSGVIATGIDSTEDINFRSQEKIEFDYIEQSNFNKFLFQREKGSNLVLQKFIEPNNNKNALIKVSWTPQFCVLYRKTNINEINNIKIPLVNRLTTFEGPEHLSLADNIPSPLLGSELEQSCETIVRHIKHVTNGNQLVSKMVLYFKLDEKNRLWLLFCTELRFKDQGSPTNKVFKKKQMRPLSPVLSVATKKEEKMFKNVMKAEYLLDDQMNILDPLLCLKCENDGLLYDIKIRMMLEYEERIKQNASRVDGDLMQSDLFNGNGGAGNPEGEFDFWKKEKAGANKIPSILKRLYPNISVERYNKLKSNVSFMNMDVKVCENCYLETTAKILENNEERKAKKMRITLKDKLKNLGLGSTFTSTIASPEILSPASANRFRPDPFITQMNTASGSVTARATTTKIVKVHSLQPMKVVKSQPGKVGGVDISKLIKAGYITVAAKTEGNEKDLDTSESVSTMTKAGMTTSNLSSQYFTGVSPRDFHEKGGEDQRMDSISKQYYETRDTQKLNETSRMPTISPYSFDVTIREKKHRGKVSNIETVIMKRKEEDQQPDFNRKISVPVIGSHSGGLMTDRGTLYNSTNRTTVKMPQIKTARTNYTSVMSTIQDLKSILNSNM